MPSKKEADAYDKMLDLAEVLNDWLVTSPLEMDDVQRDTMAMWLAERKEALAAYPASWPTARARDARTGRLRAVGYRRDFSGGDDAVPAAKARKAKAA
ncbi:LexA family transcriptional regulator [Klebsiella pneumoniae subsp. ozaenae]|uniref:LexA family transcriptional regulator n=1 Tax=Klebsiella pneumoniae subsp. ozaenae TaxID=574 RepID=A0A378BGG0_KLEPO|nr:LexA family transcriptional regulator [Klebsiella pneumoniae subsp. ozaenae]